MLYKNNFNKPRRALLKITSLCDQSCDFCSEMPFIKNRRSSMEVEEIIANYRYLLANFNICSVILSGGEPTLHGDYFAILDFFSKQNTPFKIITNLIKFSDSNFSKKHESFFRKNKNWQVVGSINRLPLNESNCSISGLKNILKINIPVSIITVAYKANLVELPKLIQYINKIFVYSKTPFRLELRLIYIEEVHDSVINQAPKDFSDLSQCFEECLQLSDSSGINVTLWNFPVCYLNGRYRNLDCNVERRKEEIMVKIDKDSQLRNFKARDFKKFFFKDVKCKLCKYFKNCSGINKKYINDFNFAKLKTIA